MTSVEYAGAIQAMQKAAVVPLALAGVGSALWGATMLGLTGLGLYGAGSDIYQGVKDRSIGKTLWGAAQIPLAVGGGALMGGSKILRAVGKYVPGMATAAKVGDKAIGGAGNLILGGAVKGLKAVGLPGAGKYVAGAGDFTKAMAGGTAINEVGQRIAGGDSPEEEGQEGQEGAEDQTAGQSHEPPIRIGAQQHTPEIRNVAPKIEFPPMPGAAS